MKNYTFTYGVRLDDLDYMGIVGNSNWLTFLERARIDLLEEVEFPFSKMMKQKIGGVVAELNIKFIKPAYFNDKLNIVICPHSPFSKGLSLKYIVTNQESLECLQADIKIIFVNQNGKAITMPDILKNKFFAK